MLDSRPPSQAKADERHTTQQGLVPRRRVGDDMQHEAYNSSCSKAHDDEQHEDDDHM
jgi:hypothetical protein